MKTCLYTSDDFKKKTTTSTKLAQMTKLPLLCDLHVVNYLQHTCTYDNYCMCCLNLIRSEVSDISGTYLIHCRN